MHLKCLLIKINKMPSQKRLVHISTAIFRAKFWFRLFLLEAWRVLFVEPKIQQETKMANSNSTDSTAAPPCPFSAEAFDDHNDDEDETAGEVVIQKKRIKWKPMEAVVQKKGKKPRKIFPILDDDNWMDILLARQLLHDQPFAAPYGQTGKAWVTLAEDLSDAVDPEDEDVLVYPNGLTDKACKTRFNDLMAYIKKNMGHVPFESGTTMPRNPPNYKLA